VILYTSYRKALRPEKFNGKANEGDHKSRQSTPDKEPAIKRQEQYIMDSAYKSVVRISQKGSRRRTSE